jgi:gluconokinase
MIILVMGVTGSGKSMIGQMLAERLNWIFLEADNLHSAANIEKMRRGFPLDDLDRKPWLDAIHAELLSQDAAGKNIVLACSALKEDYRQQLKANLDVKIIYLRGTNEFIGQRLKNRTGHFAKEAILPNQFAVLEEPKNALVVDIAQTPEKIVEEILQKIATTPFYSKGSKTNC